MLTEARDRDVRFARVHDFASLFPCALHAEVRFGILQAELGDTRVINRTDLFFIFI